MKNSFVSATLTAFALVLFSAGCAKPTEEQPTPVENETPTIVDGSRLIIRFGHMTQMGCMYTFSNCIYIGWGTDAALSANRIVYKDGKPVRDYYGAYFPLTSDFTAPGGADGKPLVFKSGFYPIRETSAGTEIVFAPDNPFAVAPLVNPANPQDNLGQLHNLGIQQILTAENRKAIAALQTRSEIRAFLTEKSNKFLAENGINLKKGENLRIQQAEWSADYANYRDWMPGTRLSANDQKILGAILEEAGALKIQSTRELSAFVERMTQYEKRYASGGFDDPQTMLAALSVMKYSRYYWFWKGMSAGADNPGQKDWWIADLKGFIKGGIGQALVDSLFAALN